jgi:agmatinase
MKEGIDLVSTQQIKKEGIAPIIKKIRKRLEQHGQIYLSVDMEVIDPAFARAVQNREADGIATTDLLDIVCSLCDKRVVGFDILEIAPVTIKVYLRNCSSKGNVRNALPNGEISGNIIF